MEELSFITAKGGQGCSTTAACMALLAGKPRVLLVDWGTDLPAVLGMVQPSDEVYGPIEVTEQLSLASSAWWSQYGVDPADWDVVIHDVGLVDGSRVLPGEVLLVTRLCYVAARRATVLQLGTELRGVIVIEEPGRALNARDLSNAIGAPVVSTLPWEPAIHRAVDAGLLASRVSNSVRALRNILPASA